MSAQREHAGPDSVLITHISRANLTQACEPTHHRNYTWPSSYALRLWWGCMNERCPMFWLLRPDGAAVSGRSDTTWVSKTDGDCLVVWIYRFMITGSVAGNKLPAKYACVCVGEDDRVLGGMVSQLNPEKLRACWLTGSQRSTLLFELILSYLSSPRIVCAAVSCPCFHFEPQFICHGTSACLSYILSTEMSEDVLFIWQNWQISEIIERCVLSCRKVEKLSKTATV